MIFRMKKLIAFSIVFYSILAKSETELNYILGSNVEKSDNLSQTVSGESGTVWETEGSFSLESTDFKDWEFQVSGRASYLDYSLSSLEDEDRTDFSVITRYEPSNTNFYFNLLENFSQVPANRFQISGVNNQRDSNVFAVSPNYYFKLSPVTRMELHYQYADYTIESDLLTSLLQDNDRIESKDVDFDNESEEIGRDFTQDDLLLRWDANNPTTNLSLSVGRFRVEDISGGKVDDNQFRLFFRRQINRLHSLDFQATRGIAQLFTINTATGTITINQQNNAVTRAQLSQGGGGQYIYSDGIFSANIGYFENKLSGLFERSEEVRSTYNLRLNFLLSKLMDSSLTREITISSSRTNNQFDVEFSNIVENNVQQYSITYTHFSSRNLSYYLTFVDQDASRIDLEGLTTDQDSRSLAFGFTYQVQMNY